MSKVTGSVIPGTTSDLAPVIEFPGLARQRRSALRLIEDARGHAARALDALNELFVNEGWKALDQPYQEAIKKLISSLGHVEDALSVPQLRNE